MAHHPKEREQNMTTHARVTDPVTPVAAAPAAPAPAAVKEPTEAQKLAAAEKARKAEEKTKKEAAKAAKAVEKAAAAATKIAQNGVSRPAAGTSTGRIWEICDAISATQGKAAPRKDVIEQATKEGLNDSTAATQYGRWRKFHGLVSERPAVAVSAPATATPSPA